MNNEERILQILERHEDTFREISKTMAEMKSDMAEMKSDMAEMKSDMAEMKSDMAEMKETLTRVAITQENVVLPRLDLLAEGHKGLLDKLEELAPKSRVEALEDDVATLKDVVKLTRREVSELKKAE